MKMVLAVLVGLVVFGCGLAQADEDAAPAEEVAQPASVPLGQPFELAVGQSTTIAETGVQITLLGVREDSRCPPNVNCIWAGQVTIELQVQTPTDAPETFTLSTMFERSHVYAGHTIELHNVTPGPAPAGQAVPEQDYRAELVASTS
jgi:hypothetical protein